MKGATWDAKHIGLYEDNAKMDRREISSGSAHVYSTVAGSCELGNEL
jgi:hypothetical protein